MKEGAVVNTENLSLILAALLGAGGTAFFLKLLIPTLRRLRIGQRILADGPVWHKKKEGTPTMGGVAFDAVIPLVFAAFSMLLALTDGFSSVLNSPAFWVTVYALGCGLCGMVDDLFKLRRRENKGLSAIQKYLALLFVTVVFLFGMNRFCGLGTSLYIPFVHVNVDLGIFFWIFAVILLTGTVNAVNLTDGVDGLCGSVTAAVLLFFFAISLFYEKTSLTLLSAVGFGGCMGFLVFNLHPAAVFMGDTGSLFLGALVSGLAFALGSPLCLFIVGFVYMLEALSVILQVVAFKTTGKRLFKMSPFHHHLEKCGWSENRIVGVFTALTAILGTVYFIFEATT